MASLIHISVHLDTLLSPCQVSGTVLGSLATLVNWATGSFLEWALQSDDKDTEHIWRDGKMDSIIVKAFKKFEKKCKLS